jgi:hypothetical protein
VRVKVAAANVADARKTRFRVLKILMETKVRFEE